MAQISAEEIKDTRVVYLEIEAQNLDKKVLFFKNCIACSCDVSSACLWARNLSAFAGVQLRQVIPI